MRGPQLALQWWLHSSDRAIITTVRRLGTVSDGASWYRLSFLQLVEGMRLDMTVNWYRLENGKSLICHSSVKKLNPYTPERIWGCLEDVIHPMAPHSSDKMSPGASKCIWLTMRGVTRGPTRVLPCGQTHGGTRGQPRGRRVLQPPPTSICSPLSLPKNHHPPFHYFNGVSHPLLSSSLVNDQTVLHHFSSSSIIFPPQWPLKNLSLTPLQITSWIGWRIRFCFFPSFLDDPWGNLQWGCWVNHL